MLKIASAKWPSIFVVVSLMAASGKARATPALERGQGVLLAPATAATGFQVLTGGASFGTAVSVHTASTNDIYGNSLGDIDYVAVGEPSYNANTGRAWLYYRTSGSNDPFTRVQLIPKEFQRSGDRFGSAITVRDGVVVVGAPGMGGVYIFSRNKNDQLGQFTQPYRDILSTNNYGRSVTYSGFQGGTVAACGDDRCRFYAMTATGQLNGNVWAKHPNSQDSGSWNDVTGFKRALIVPGWLDFVAGATDPKEAGGNVVIFGNGSGPNGNGYGGAGTVYPPGAGSWGNFTADALRMFIGGPTTGVTTQFLHNPFLYTTSFGTVFNPTGSLQFGKQVAYSGSVLMVTDSLGSGSSSIVYRYQLNDQGTSNTTDDTWTLSGDFGTNDASYGSSMGLYGTTAVIGDPNASSVYVWDANNPVSQFTYPPNPGPNDIEVHVTQSDPNDLTTVTPDPTCAAFPGYIVSGFPHACVNVKTTAQLFGTQKVCFPGGLSTLFRCHPQDTLCVAPQSPGATVDGKTSCCELLPSDTTSVPGKLCALTPGFSSFAAGTGTDRDADFIPDLVDNCPQVANSLQVDFDGDLVGDACDNCPNVPNQNQADTNHNGIGDACEAVQPVPASSPRFLLLLGIACGVLGAMTLGRAAIRRAAT